MGRGSPTRRDDTNKILGALQLQSKKPGPFKVYLVQGGVHLTDTTGETGAAVFQALHDRSLKLRWTDFLLVNYYGTPSETYDRSMLKLGYFPNLGNKMYSFYIRLSNGAEGLEQTLTRNWRHNLRRAEKNSKLFLNWCEQDSEREAAFVTVSQMYDNLKERKSFRGAVNTKTVKGLVVRDRKFLILAAEVSGAPVAVRIGYLSNTCTMDFLAASNEGAKSNYANYRLLWTLIKKAESFGLDGFECGGVDPVENYGVYNFKRGLGAGLSLYGPLWLFNKNGF